MAQQIVEVVDGHAARFQFVDQRDEFERLREGMILFDRCQRIGVQRLERIEPRELL